jgi:hypothetical protein
MISPVEGGAYMLKKLLTLCVSLVLVFSLYVPAFADDAPKMGKQARWEGMVARSNKDQNTLTVRARGTNVEKIVHYDSSTKFKSQEHGSKKVNDIDANQINDDDRVICLGSYDDKGELHATLISKRLTK